MESDTLRNTIVTAVVLIAAAVAYKFHPRSTFAADGLSPYWDGTVEQSHATHRPSLVLFTADWCGGCQALHNNVLCRGDVAQEINSHYVMIAVDLTSPGRPEQERQRRYGISAIPTLIRFDADGKETDRTHYLPPEMMLQWLRDGE